MKQTRISNFSPLLFLSSLGAGGISVSGFILIQYGVFTGIGLAELSGVEQTVFVLMTESVMAIFAIIHFWLTYKWSTVYFSWLRTKTYKDTKDNPLIHAGLMTPFISLAMSMNVFVATVRYFVPWMHTNFQEIMPFAFVLYLILYFITMYQALSLLSIAMSKNFDVSKIHFGWLLSAFATGMITVTGTGFAALSTNDTLAGFAAFITVLSGTFTVFLMIIKSFVVYTQHIHATRRISQQFMPTYLIGIPILTLLAISVFRLGHYAEHAFGMPELFMIAKIILVSLFVVELWMLALGLLLMRGYWKGYLSKQFDVTQWGLICPFVALVALGGFVNKIFIHSDYMMYGLFIMLLGVIGLFISLLRKQLQVL